MDLNGSRHNFYYMERLSMENRSGVYKIVFVETGEVYIGSAVNFHKRWNEHRNNLRKKTHCNFKLQRLWNKHGGDKFLFEVAEYVESRNDLFAREQHWIDTIAPVLNISKIAEGGNHWLGKHRSEETKQKIREVLTGRKNGPRSKETKDKIAKANTGKKASAETIRKLSESHKGYKPTDETRKRLSEAKLGRSRGPMSDETKEVLRQIANAKWSDPDYKRKHHKALTKAMSNPETLKKLSEAHKGKKLTKDHIAKITASNVGKKRSKASCKRLSEARKRWWAKRKAK